VGPHGQLQRDRGQTDAGSWAAGMPVRCGVVMLVALLVTWFAPGAASAATNRPTADPAPQKAPAVSPTTPAPDPVPQASVKAAAKSQPVHSAPPTTSISRPVVTAPRIARSTAPAAATPAAVNASTVGRTPARTAPATPHHPAKVVAAPRHHPAPARRLETHPIALSLPFTPLLTDLLRFPHAVLHAGEAGHRDGVLLLLSSLAMGVLAVSSFGLLRRLRRLDRSVR
jgi:hypothetical protein